MRKLAYILAIARGIAIAATSCKTSTYARYDFKTECLGSELDGSQTLKAWGKGRYWEDAAEQAKKNAVRDVIFKGILDGEEGCFKQPLVMEVNAQEKYEAYFNKFFTDGGEFRNFVSLKDEKIPNHIIRKAQVRDKDNSVYSVVVRVKRSELKEKLIKDGIIK